MKRLLSVLMIFTMLAMVFTGCGGTNAPAPTDSASASPQASGGSNDGKEVKEIHWLAPGVGSSSWEGLIVPVLEKFYEETGIRVIAEHYSYGDLLDLIEVKLGSGSSDYDVITVDAPLVAAYASRGYLKPMDEYFTEEELAEFTKASVETGTWDGKFYATQFTSSSQLLWYNTKLLEQAGVTIRENGPNNRLTYEEIADLSRQVLDVLDPDGTNGIFGFDFQQVSRVYQMNPLANSMGGLNIGKDGFTLEGVLDSEPWIKSLTWYQDMVNSGLSTRGINADELPNYFYSDKLVFMVGATYIGTNCDAAGMNHYGYTYLPAFEGYEDKVASATGSWGFGINANAKDPDAAAEFIKFLSLGLGNDMWLEIRGDMPARNSVLEKITTDPNSPGYLKMGAYEAMNTAVPRAVTPAFNEYSTIMDTLWEDIRNGADIRSTVDNAIRQMNTAIEAYK